MTKNHGTIMPTKAQIQRAIDAAKRAGLDIAGFKVEPDGAIVVFDKSSAPKDDFSRWQENRYS